jgi:hypothetical protein
MADIQLFKVLRRGRTYIWIEVTPKSPETRALLRAFNAGVRQFEKRWKTAARARKKRKG